MFFFIIEAGSSMTLTNRDLCHGVWKEICPWFCSVNVSKRWAPQETRQNEGSSHAILGKKVIISYFFGPQTMVGSGHGCNWIHLNGMACQVFVHKNVDGKQALVRWVVHFVPVEQWKIFGSDGNKNHGKTKAVGLQQNIVILLMAEILHHLGCMKPYK